MSDSKPWFLVMTPADANRPGSQWMRQGAASRGKVVARPIAPEGWAVLLGAIALLVAVPLVVLSWLANGALSLPSGIIITLVGEAIVIGALVLIIRAKMTRLPRGVSS